MTSRRTDAATALVPTAVSPVAPASCRKVRPARAPQLQRLLSLGIVIGCLLAPQLASARSEYDPKRAGNPLKIVYYAVYPAAFLVEVLIFRPAYYIGQWEPFHTLFGTTRPPEEIEVQSDEESDEDDDS